MPDTTPDAKASSKAKPKPAASASVEPAQGHIDTTVQYRDRPTDDGKYGDGAEQSAPQVAPVKTGGK